MPTWEQKLSARFRHSEMLQKAVEHHHEAFDGPAIPSGLRGEQIPLWARILAIADAYVNMTTERSFAPAKTSDRPLPNWRS